MLRCQNPKSMSYEDKVRIVKQEVNMYIGPKIKRTTFIKPYTSTYTAIKQNTKSCIYVRLYGSGLFNFGSCVITIPTLSACFLGFDIPTSFIFI